MAVELKEITISSMVMLLLNAVMWYAMYMHNRRVVESDDRLKAMMEEISNLAKSQDERYDNLLERFDKKLDQKSEDIKKLEEQNSSLAKSKDERYDKTVERFDGKIDQKSKEVKKLEERIWELQNDLKANYSPRVEVGKLFGNLVQKVDRNQKEILTKIDNLPCLEAKCPSEKK